jgi:hypothetical protein
MLKNPHLPEILLLAVAALMVIAGAYNVALLLATCGR